MKDLTYDGNVQLIEHEDEVWEIPILTKEQLASERMKELYGGSITETQHLLALQQREDRIENQYFTERG